MKKVVCWQELDTVINRHNPKQTFTVISAKQGVGGRWITLQNIYNQEKLSGTDLGLVKMGFVGYRKTVG